MSIRSVLVCGGTHGNELSGVYAVKHWQGAPNELANIAPTVDIQYLLVNEASIEARTRYIDEDFNRQFDTSRFRNNTQALKDGAVLNTEQALAQRLYHSFGPDSDAQADLIIDIHNTTSSMGPTLIVLDNDAFNRDLARYVKTHMPSANILVEDHVPFNQHPYFCTLGKRGLMIEVGAQAQGALRAKVYEQSVEMAQHILAFVEQFNQQGAKALNFSPVQAFRLIEEVRYPQDIHGNRTAMIHENIDGNDFSALTTGDAAFTTFDGKEIKWEGETVYPHFIGEAAYDGLNIAFATASICEF
ncbi:aspartoacylase [Ningiella sp. W23]|uniref:aspartoacylase n=1 Tax=Ningiella sp. W23 TaxID=3023715 RepID=UPI00375748B5